MDMHPIVVATRPNEEQLPAVQERELDIVVTAGAGTGKTRTLVSRYLALLADGVPLRSIVAITFTRKAAREMRNRVRTVMRAFIDQGGLELDERLRWEDLYNRLDAARIGTIHSLSTEIIRAHPAEARVDPRFDILDEGQAGILLAQAVNEGLSWAADDVLAVDLFSLLGERKLKNLLENLMARRLETQEAFDGLPSPLWPLWRGRLVPAIRSFLDDTTVKIAFSELQDLAVDGTLAAAEIQGDALAPHVRKLLDFWQTIQLHLAEDDWTRISQSLFPLRQSLKLVGSKKAWSPADPKAIIKELRSLYDNRLGSLGDRPINLALDQAWAGVMPCLHRLYEQTLTQYKLLKGQGQLLDFDDLENGALKLLRDFPAVRARWQKEIRAILVDEYQDTNSRQRDLVNLIAGGGGRLFIVGDAKQSIYRFRGADVTVYREERARIEIDGGKAYELVTSYRAHEGLIAGLNNLLRPVLGENDDPSRPWREPFAPLTHFRREPIAGITGPFMEMHLTVGSKGEGALDRAAAALTAHLVDLVEQDGSEIGFGDIAILCRASTSFAAYESALDGAGIPYLTVAGRGFYDRPEIRDLLNALQAVSDPTDDLALLGFLRSPVIGFSDSALFQLCQEWEGMKRDITLWHLVQGKDDAHVARAVQIVDNLHSLAGRAPVASLLESFVNDTDYRAALIRSGNARAARNVSKLLVDAHNSGIVSAGEFLAYIKGLRSGASREGEAPATAGDIVRIMTVHAAKGLEFPVVVIGDVNYSKRITKNLLLDPELGVFPSLSDDDGGVPGMFRLLQKQDEDQEDAESDRLLYVAATRAREKLILSGCFKLTQSNQPGWLSGWLKKLDSSLDFHSQTIDYDENGEQAIKLTLEAGDSDIGCIIYEPGYDAHRLLDQKRDEIAAPDTWTPVLLDSLIEEKRQPDSEREQRRVWWVVPDRRQTHAPAWLLGTLVHEALAAWRFPGDGFDKWLETRARGHGLSDQSQLDDLIRRANTLLNRFRQHTLYDAMDKAERRVSEVPYYLERNKGRIEHRKIDALFLNGGKWTLVDFKTDKISNQTELDRALNEGGYKDQVEDYADAVEELLGQRPRSFLCLLDCCDEIYLSRL